MSLAYPLETTRRLNLKGQRTHLSEAQVQAAVLEYLATDPRVAQAWRQNAGAMVAEHKAKKRLVRFARDAQGKDVTLLDITGYLRDGRRLDIECKAQLPQPETVQKWQKMITPHRDAERYLRQLAVIENARACGCVAGFVVSVDDAQQLIDAAFGD